MIASEKLRENVAIKRGRSNRIRVDLHPKHVSLVSHWASNAAEPVSSSDSPPVFDFRDAAAPPLDGKGNTLYNL